MDNYAEPIQFCEVLAFNDEIFSVDLDGFAVLAAALQEYLLVLPCEEVVHLLYLAYEFVADMWQFCEFEVLRAELR